MTLTPAKRKNRNAARKAKLRERYGDDWKPTYCNWCSRSEPVRHAAVELPIDGDHPRPTTIFCLVSVHPHRDGTVVRDGARKVANHARHGDNAWPVPLFYVAPSGADPTKLYRMHTMTRCTGVAELPEEAAR